MANPETPEQWEKIKAIFGAALECEPEDRSAFIENACGANESMRAEVASLLSAHEKSSPLSRAPWSGAADQEAAAPQFIGPYHLIEKLGEGGMGQVWLADQSAPVKRRVALKLIRTGIYDASLRQRFQAERQSLAIMDHPAIAKVFDAGTTEAGQPYFVMEYVPGLPITKYCDQKKLNIRERIELFIEVCEGVQHAHQKAIIHRDLKPANILVVEVNGKPVPRIIDFGLAKAISAQSGETLFTQSAGFLGTPGYTSPEQADPHVHDIDTRTDVYSLGVVLYVLLSGFEPVDAEEWRKMPLDEVLRRLRDRDLPTPSTRVSSARDAAVAVAESRGLEPQALASALRGDLDWITMKAVERDRTRRYGTPSDLAADMRRYLDNEPVLARPASVGYRLQKYVRRNRIGVTVGAVIVTMLVSFGILQALQLRRITRERDRANRVSEFMTSMFKVADPSEARGRTITAREILDKASKDIGSGLSKDAELQAHMMDLMGIVYMNLGSYSSAQPLLERAIEVWTQTKGPNSKETLEARHYLALVVGSQAHFAEAEKLEKENLEVYKKTIGVKNAGAVRSMETLGVTIENEGKYTEAEALDREALGIARSVLGEDNPDTITVLNSLGSVLQREGRYSEAEAIHRKALEQRRRVLGNEHSRTTISMQVLANDLRGEGKFAEAEQLDREALEIRTRVLGPEHPYTLSVRRDVARDLVRQGNYPAAVEMNKQTIEMARRVLGNGHSDLGSLLINLSENYLYLEKYPEAEQAAREAIEIDTKALGPDHTFTLVARNNLANALFGEGKYHEGEEEARKVLDVGERKYGADSSKNIEALEVLAKCLSNEKHYEDADQMARKVLKLERDKPADDASPEATALASYNLASIVVHEKDRRSEAIPLLQDAVEHGLDPKLGLKIEHDADFASLHDDPAFPAIIAKARQNAAAAQAAGKSS